jgi:hypothetical protein
MCINYCLLLFLRKKSKAQSNIYNKSELYNTLPLFLITLLPYYNITFFNL